METGSKYCLLDGGFATELFETHGHNLDDDPLWGTRVITSHPQHVANIHRSFLLAGSDVIETGTYQASIAGLKDHLSINYDEAVGIISEGVKICVNERDIFWQESQNTDRSKPLVAGSVGPYGAHCADRSEYTGKYVDNMSIEELMVWHRPQVEIIWRSGVDILAFETIPARKEAEAIIRLLKEFPDSKAWISFSCRNEKETCHGDSISDVFQSINCSDQVIGCGINCTAPWLVEPLLSNIPVAVRQTKPVLVYPNKGQWSVDNVDGSPTGVPSLNNYVPKWIELGATWIGGCCNVLAADIANLRIILDEHIVRSQPNNIQNT